MVLGASKDVATTGHIRIHDMLFKSEVVSSGISAFMSRLATAVVPKSAKNQSMVLKSLGAPEFTNIVRRWGFAVRVEHEVTLPK